MLQNSPERSLAYRAYINRENNIRHHYYDEEMKQYELMKTGDPSAVEESARMMSSNLHGHLSDDPVRNIKYLLVACITITTRFAIEGGLDSETAYNTSDMYILRMDALSSVEDVLALHREMFTFFTNKMAQLRIHRTYSKPVNQSLEYIDQHLHTQIRIEELAGYVHLNSSYLSVLFKKETGVPVSEYVMQRKVETAKNMIRYSDYSAAEISEILAFSSQSYFIRCFRKVEGITPNEYRRFHYQESLAAASGRQE